jgi:hypothetical protein
MYVLQLHFCVSYIISDRRHNLSECYLYGHPSSYILQEVSPTHCLFGPTYMHSPDHLETQVNQAIIIWPEWQSDDLLIH